MLTDVSGTEKRFFVRAKGEVSGASEAEKVFGAIEVMQAGLEGEYGFVTERMSEGEFFEKAGEFGAMISMLRLRDKTKSE